jgi:hypothetical protein
VAGQRLGVGHPVPELQRAGVERGRLAVGVHGLRRLRGPHGRGQRGRLIPRSQVVMGDARGEVGAAVPR